MNRFGFWAAVGACVASLGYAIPQLLQVLDMLPTPLDRILIFAPSLMLAPLFVITLAAAYEAASPPSRSLRLAALVLAILYAGLASNVYITQLGVVIPHEARGAAQATAVFKCCDYQMPTTALDLLGYTYMAVALLLLAPTYKAAGLRWVLVANGILAPFLILQLIWPSLIYMGAVWLVIFPTAMALMAQQFRGSVSNDAN
jgi:hypothetical protein